MQHQQSLFRSLFACRTSACGGVHVSRSRCEVRLFTPDCVCRTRSCGGVQLSGTSCKSCRASSCRGAHLSSSCCDCRSGSNGGVGTPTQCGAQVSYAAQVLALAVTGVGANRDSLPDVLQQPQMGSGAPLQHGAAPTLVLYFALVQRAATAVTFFPFTWCLPHRCLWKS